MPLGIHIKQLSVLLGFIALSANAIYATAISDSTKTPSSDTLAVEIYPDDPVLLAMDMLWADERLHWQNFESDTVCKNIYNFPAGYIPQYSDSVIMSRLEKLNQATPLELEYNRHVKGFISLYVDRRRDLTARVLGLAELYYPLFEEKLDQFDIPLELKHLAVVESALNASARSRVGASGLWQFMYNTGRMYGLEVDNYVDDRSDAYKSTIAACRYMSYLYGIYGDWNMVLAAYNSGPGNVNKAIRRSGGKRDYWAIWDYLPRETRSYVPAFIAVNYVMNYAAEHNIYAVQPEFLYAEIDTIEVCKRATFDQISHFTGVSVAQLEVLNPSLKRNIVPASDKCRVIYLPVEAIGLFLANEDSLYQYNLDVPQAVDGLVVEEVVKYYTVKRGDVLGSIAQRNGVGLSDLRAWNNIRGNTIHPGQKLTIKKTVKTPVSAAAKPTTTPAATKQATASTNGTKTDKNNSVDQKFHVVQSGDTLWDIAKMYPGISVNDIKSANSDLNYNRLKPGQKIKIPPTS